MVELLVKLRGGQCVELQAVPPRTGQVGRPIIRTQPVSRDLQSKVIDSVKAQLVEAAKDVLAAMAARFPSDATLDAHAMLCPEMWSQG